VTSGQVVPVVNGIAQDSQSGQKMTAMVSAYSCTRTFVTEID